MLSFFCLRIRHYCMLRNSKTHFHFNDRCETGQSMMISRVMSLFCGKIVTSLGSMARNHGVLDSSYLVRGFAECSSGSQILCAGSKCFQKIEHKNVRCDSIRNSHHTYAFFFQSICYYYGTC